MNGVLFTVGHSDHSLDRFVELLLQHGVTMICDVRSIPFSRHTPQFDRELLRRQLEGRGISYAFFGNSLGGRASDEACHVDGRIQYAKVAKSAAFCEGLGALRLEAGRHRVALMCTERDPLMCHRAILLCRYLKPTNPNIQHILADGRIETLQASEERLLQLGRLDQADLFEPLETRIGRAYDIQGERIAYRRERDDDRAVVTGP